MINSETYQRVIDDKAALYYQSPRYVYEFLKNEHLTGKARLESDSDPRVEICYVNVTDKYSFFCMSCDYICNGVQIKLYGTIAKNRRSAIWHQCPPVG